MEWGALLALTPDDFKVLYTPSVGSNSNFGDWKVPPFSFKSSPINQTVANVLMNHQKRGTFQIQYKIYECYLVNLYYRTYKLN